MARIQEDVKKLPKKNTEPEPGPLDGFVISEVTYRHDPNSGYTDMRNIIHDGRVIRYILPSDLEEVDERLRKLKMNEIWKGIDEMALRFTRELVEHDPIKWKKEVARKEQFMGKMEGYFLRSIDRLNTRIESAYKKINNPAHNVDPAYRAAFDAKVEEVREFLRRIGL